MSTPSVSRRAFLGSASAAGLAAAGCSGNKARRDRRPNVLVVLTDDQRWDCMSCAGHPLLKTPHMDRLANEGARFSNAFVTTSLCSPSRATLLSGLYAHSHGVTNNFTEFPANLPNYPKLLQTAGYETGYIGKWHMGEDNDSPRAGFDYWASHKGQGKYFDTEFNVNGKRELLKGYYTHRVTDLAVDFLKKPRQRPFSLILGHKAPHSANVPEPKYATLFDKADIRPPDTSKDKGKGKWVEQRKKTWHGIEGPLYENHDYGKFVRTYLATIPSIDDSVGMLYDTLKQTGELDNTLFVFLGDNGCLLGEHWAVDKRVMWEESIRVPLIARYPEGIPLPTVRDEMVVNIDFAPTILDFCGAPEIKGAHGRSWRRLAAGANAEWRKSWYYEYNFEDQFPYTPNVRGIRTDRWKYIHYPNGEGQPETEKAELYDLKADPKELNNLIDDENSQEPMGLLKNELERLKAAAGGVPDRMPVNPRIRFEMPDQKIR